MAKEENIIPVETLIKACQGFDIEILRQYIEKGVSLSSNNQRSKGILNQACNNTTAIRQQHVELLLECDVDIDIPENIFRSSGFWPCSFQLLMEYGAYFSDPTIKSLLWAIDHCYDNFGALILHWGCKEDLDKAVDEYSWTPLHYACRQGLSSTVEALIAHGLDLEAKTDTSATPFLFACSSGHEQLAIMMIKRFQVGMKIMPCIMLVSIVKSTWQNY